MRGKFEPILEEKLQPLIEAEGFELIEVEVLRGGRQRIVRVFVDTPGGVTLEQCARLSRQLGPVLDAMELFEDRYVLEVSSPGATRSLKREQDFVRFTGKLAQLSLSEPVQGRAQWIGDLGGMEGSDVLLWPKDGGEVLRIPHGLVRAARLEYESPQEREARQKGLQRGR